MDCYFIQKLNHVETGIPSFLHIIIVTIVTIGEKIFEKKLYKHDGIPYFIKEFNVLFLRSICNSGIHGYYSVAYGSERRHVDCLTRHPHFLKFILNKLSFSQK